MNDITLVGRIGSDIDYRELSSTTVANFSFAVNRRVRKDGDWETETVWLRATAFGKLADNIAQLSKGQAFIGIGYLKENSWTDKEGNNRKSVEFTLSDGGPSVKWDPAGGGSSASFGGEEAAPF